MAPAGISMAPKSCCVAAPSIRRPFCCAQELARRRSCAHSASTSLPTCAVWAAICRTIRCSSSPQMCGEEEQRMVLQIAAHTAQVGNDVDAECAQLRRRANSCAQQKGRRMDGAATQHDFGAMEIPAGAIDHRRDTSYSPSFEQKPGDGCAGDNREVLAAADARIEIAHRG